MSTLASWDEMGNGRRAALVAGVALILALTAVAFLWLSAKNYRVLFSDLEPRDASAVVSELERLKVDFKLADAGTRILVPENDVHAVRLKLMGSGVPLNGGVGFEIFDNSDFGMTGFAQRINYQRALEGELTRTIMTLEEVKYARVHLVLPENGLFEREDNPTSASVTLFLKQEVMNTARRPVQAQIVGIQRLVSSAVPGLKPGQVTVTDQAGMTLSQHMPDQSAMAAVSGRLQQKQSVESYLTGKVNEVLDRTFGPGQAMVSVDVVLNFDEVKLTLENVVEPQDGESGVVRRRETRVMPANESQDARGNVTTEVEYRLGRTVEQVVQTPGEIQRLSVGVMVPSDTNEQRREQIRALVEMAVGLDATRGDALAVYTMDQPLLTSDAPVPVFDAGNASPIASDVRLAGADSQGALSQRYPMHVGALVAALGMLVLFALVYLLTRRGTSQAGAQPLTGAEREQALARLTGWLEQANASEQGDAA